MNSVTGQNPESEGHREDYELCQQELERVIGKTDSVVFASLNTLDGRSLAFVEKHGSIEGQRVAAISSSIMSLSEAFGKETLNGQCSYNAISTNFGSIVTIRLPTKTPNFALSLCSDRDESMAMALRTTFDTAEGLAAILDQG